jgi:hypothetical protein
MPYFIMFAFLAAAGFNAITLAAPLASREVDFDLSGRELYLIAREVRDLFLRLYNFDLTLSL